MKRLNCIDCGKRFYHPNAIRMLCNPCRKDRREKANARAHLKWKAKRALTLELRRQARIEAVKTEAGRITIEDRPYRRISLRFIREPQNRLYHRAVRRLYRARGWTIDGNGDINWCNRHQSSIPMDEALGSLVTCDQCWDEAEHETYELLVRVRARYGLNTDRQAITVHERRPARTRIKFGSPLRGVA